MKKAWLQILLSVSLFAEGEYLSDVSSPETRSVLTDIHGEPSAIVGGHVHVISGDFMEHEVDLMVPSPEPFVFSRSYWSSDQSNSPFLPHWHHNHQGHALLFANARLRASAMEAHGERIYFEEEKFNKKKEYAPQVDPVMFEYGFTNVSKGMISGQYHLKNTSYQFHYSHADRCSIQDGSGEIREYRGFPRSQDKHFVFHKDGFANEYRLVSTKKPSGMSFGYTHYEELQLASITLQNRLRRPIAHLKINYTKTKEHGIKKDTIHVETPDKRYVDYKLEAFGSDHRFVLREVESSDGPTITYEYEDRRHLPICRKSLPEGRFLAVEYYHKGKNKFRNRNIEIKDHFHPAYNRVKQILAPCGHDETPHALYSFDYCLPWDPKAQWGTGVYDALGNKTDFYFSRKNRLERILKFDQGEIPYTLEQIFWWDKNKEAADEACMKTRCFGRWGSPSQIYARSYFYDQRKNLILDALYGNIRGVSDTPLLVDSAGNVVSPGPDVKMKQCIYSEDGLNLLILQQEGELFKGYTYLPETNLVTSCLEWSPQGIFARTFYDYDENGMIVKKICDDGIFLDSSDLTRVTVRTIDYTKRSTTYPVGLPVEVRKMYWDQGEEKLAFRKVNTFDNLGRMIKQEVFDANDVYAYAQEWEYNDWGNLLMEKNALGATIYRSYDLNGNKIREEGPELNTFKEFTYDYSNRLIKIEEHHPDGILSQHFRYDLMGNKIASVDSFGHETHYTYDAFGRVLSETIPGGHTTYYEYDELSHLTSVTDPLGRTTKMAHTILGKPYKIDYPDGSQERFEYDLDGRLVKEISKSGMITQNTYDYQGRLIKQENGESSQEWGYNSIHLLYEKDVGGLVTTYTYDAQGRKVAIQQGDRLTTLEYDSMSRVHKITSEGTVKVMMYNVLDQLVEEREEDLESHILKQTFYEYDLLGRKVKTISGASVNVCRFDTHGLPVESIDAEGNVSRVFANYHHINEEGETVYLLEEINPKGNKIQSIYNKQGKVALKQVFNPFGKILHQTKTDYDACGNTAQLIETPYCKEVACEPRILCFEYDLMNRATSLIQAAGSKEEKRTEHRYDLSGKKIATIKPDGTELHYHYDTLGRLVEYYSSREALHYTYIYDAKNNPIQVNDFVAGTQAMRKYDLYNHLTEETLHNHLKVGFQYSPGGKILSLQFPDGSDVSYTYQGSFVKTLERGDYIHRYEAYDLAGRVLQEQMIFGVGEKNYRYSPRGNLLELKAPHFTEKSTRYDSHGNLLARTLIDNQGRMRETFAYDDLDQLTQETGHESHTYTHDSLNNRLAKDDETYQVNLLNQIMGYSYDLCGNLIEKDGVRYTYDPIDRLTKVEGATFTLEYTYDEQNRCMSCTEKGRDPLRFFYFNQIELGACTPEGAITQLQLLGPGRKTEPCAAAVIELNQVPYAVLHDQSGHVRALVDKEGQAAMTYRYTAFGIMKAFGDLANPWTVAGKRYEPLSGLVLFGLRFYSPEMGRWLTQDPAGYDAGPNLYAYLFNCPIGHYDALGLFENNTGGLRTIVESIFNIVLSAKHFVGKVIYGLSWHFIPIPLIKDIPMAVGHFFSQGTFDGYTMTYSRHHSQIVTAGHVIRPGVGHCAGNGILVPYDDKDQCTQEISEAYGGERVRFVWGATHGLFQDLGECFLKRMGVRTHQVQVTEHGLRMALEDAGEGGYVIADFHSGGGISLRNARYGLSPQEESALFINTYGTGAINSKNKAAYVMNYMSPKDPVPVTDWFKYIKARLFGSDHVKFVESKTSDFMEHGFRDPTYRAAFRQGVEASNKFLVDKKI